MYRSVVVCIGVCRSVEECVGVKGRVYVRSGVCQSAVVRMCGDECVCV